MDGSLRARHLDNATKLAKGTVWPKLISRIPPGYEMVPTLGGQRVNTCASPKPRPAASA
jgi:hypothetical protein